MKNLKPQSQNGQTSTRKKGVTVWRAGAIGTLLGLLAIGSVGCAGTKPLPPSFYARGTSTAVSVGLRNSPHTANELRVIQPLACAVAAGTNLSPASLGGVVAGKDLSAETLGIYNGIMLLYVAAFNSLPDATQATVQPYATAVFCDGFAAGLALSPGAPTVAAAAKLTRKMPKGAVIEAQWPLVVGKGK